MYAFWFGLFSNFVKFLQYLTELHQDSWHDKNQKVFLLTSSNFLFPVIISYRYRSVYCKLNSRSNGRLFKQYVYAAFVLSYWNKLDNYRQRGKKEGVRLRKFWPVAVSKRECRRNIMFFDGDREIDKKKSSEGHFRCLGVKGFEQRDKFLDLATSGRSYRWTCMRRWRGYLMGFFADCGE